MPKGPKGFSDAEKKELRKKICLACEQSWALHGYKKTSIGELTANIGISTGAFYLLYPSKEDLFCETLERVQDRLKKEILEIIKNEKGKAGYRKALIWHFQEYDRFPFLYNFNTPDFMAFLNKLPAEHIERLSFDSMSFFYEMTEVAGLTLKVDKDKAYAVLSTLLFTVTLKERFNYDRFEVFEFLLDSVLDELFD